MAFGQQSGPPASGRQVQQLLDLLRAAGHDDFRDARGPMGFTQRQAAGKFTRDEAAAFIDTLEEEAAAGDGAGGDLDPTERPAERPTGPSARPTAAGQALRQVPDEQLAAELQRRGWVVVQP